MLGRWLRDKTTWQGYILPFIVRRTGFFKRVTNIYWAAAHHVMTFVHYQCLQRTNAKSDLATIPVEEN